MNLFSSFDIVLYKYFYFVFVSLILLFSTVKLNFKYLTLYGLSNFFVKLLYIMKPKAWSKATISLMMGMFLMLFIFNIVSLTSYNFALSSNFGPMMFISMILWLSIMKFVLFNNTMKTVLHLIPQGSPIFLSMFLLMIEIISNMIRPLTLTVRLMSNILCGHLIMSLLFMLVNKISINFIIIFLFLNIFELFVSLIQSYIFFMLLSLYIMEI